MARRVATVDLINIRRPTTCRVRRETHTRRAAGGGRQIRDGRQEKNGGQRGQVAGAAPPRRGPVCAVALVYPWSRPCDRRSRLVPHHVPRHGKGRDSHSRPAARTTSSHLVVRFETSRLKEELLRAIVSPCPAPWQRAMPSVGPDGGASRRAVPPLAGHPGGA